MLLPYLSRAKSVFHLIDISFNEIIFVDNMEDLQTSTITIKAQVPNDDLSLTPGQFVRVKVTGSTYECPVIPNSCVLASPNGNIVYVIDSDKKASIRPVKVKLLGNKAVVMEGLKAGETVVSEGLIKVRNGAPVTPIAKDKVDDQAKNSQQSSEKVADKANPENKVN
jgi:membrane fusion protein (multidrug efflux system)